MEKKMSTVGIVVAVIASIILIPLIMLTGFAGGSTTAVATLFQEDSEEAWFSSFEENGGVSWIYDMVKDEITTQEAELKQTFKKFVEEEINRVVDEELEQWKEQLSGLSTEMEEEMLKQYQIEAADKKQQLLSDLNNALATHDIIGNLITYDEVSMILHGIYSAVLEGNTYRFDLSAQIERCKNNLHQCLSNTELFDYVNDSYFEDINQQIDTIALSLETNLNQAVEAFYQDEILGEFNTIERNYNINMLDRDALGDIMRVAVVFLVVTIIILVALLLLSYLFRPSGFFVTATTLLITGGLLVTIALVFGGFSFARFISVYDVPHASLINVLDEIVNQCASGFRSWGFSCVICSVVFYTIGGVILATRKPKQSVEETAVYSTNEIK